MIGRLTTGSIGLGWLAVIGRSLVPSPPAITTAFTADVLLSRRSPRPGARRPGRRYDARRRLWSWPGASQELSRLHEVKHGSAPVQGTSPDSKGPTGHPCSLRVT